MQKYLGLFIIFLFFIGCASKFQQNEYEEMNRRQQELAKLAQVQVVPVPPPPVTTQPPPLFLEENLPKAPSQPVTKAEAKKNEIKKTEKKKKTKTEITKPSLPILPLKRQPEYEDGEGFEGHRRPLVDPYRVGEKVVLDVNYMKLSAGELTLEIPEMVEVNGRKAYRMVTKIKTYSAFSTFYSVDDMAETLMDYIYMTPSLFALHVRESGQMREGKAVFDMLGGQAHHWETKISKKKGKEEKDNTWDILAYSQNVFSAAFYMRVFKWDLDKEYQFNVADDKENLMFKGRAIRKEKISTDLGEIDTIVVKPQFTAKGVFKPVGDIFIWLTDDEQKQIVRLESSIKIGTLVADLISREKGTPNK